MAKTIMKLPNEIRVKYLKRPQKYFLFWGNNQVLINNKRQAGFDDFQDAVEKGERLCKTECSYKWEEL